MIILKLFIHVLSLPLFFVSILPLCSLSLSPSRYCRTNNVRHFLLKRPFHQGKKDKSNEYKVKEREGERERAREMSIMINVYVHYFISTCTFILLSPIIIIIRHFTLRGQYIQPSISFLVYWGGSLSLKLTWLVTYNLQIINFIFHTLY